MNYERTWIANALLLFNISLPVISLAAAEPVEFTPKVGAEYLSHRGSLQCAMLFDERARDFANQLTQLNSVTYEPTNLARVSQHIRYFYENLRDATQGLTTPQGFGAEMFEVIGDYDHRARNAAFEPYAQVYPVVVSIDFKTLRNWFRRPLDEVLLTLVIKTMKPNGTIDMSVFVPPVQPGETVPHLTEVIRLRSQTSQATQSVLSEEIELPNQDVINIRLTLDEKISDNRLLRTVLECRRQYDKVMRKPMGLVDLTMTERVISFMPGTVEDVFARTRVLAPYHKMPTPLKVLKGTLQ